MIEQELFEILQESFDVNINTIDKHTKLRDYLDSIDFLGFLMLVRKKYKINIDQNEIKNIQNVEQVADLVRLHSKNSDS